MKVKLTESKLKQIVEESVKNVLNEISSDLLFKASEKANTQNREQQADSFLTYGKEQQRQELEANGNILDMTPKFIEFRTPYGYTRLTTNGKIAGNASGHGFNLNVLELDSGSRKSNGWWRVVKTDKQTARIIANWVNRYITDKTLLNTIGDWHYWAAL